MTRMTIELDDELENDIYELSYRKRQNRCVVLREILRREVKRELQEIEQAQKASKWTYRGHS